VSHTARLVGARPCAQAPLRRVVKVEPTRSDRFAFVVIHPGLDAVRSPSVPLATIYAHLFEDDHGETMTALGATAAPKAIRKRDGDGRRTPLSARS
jgi:hypothetical protein